MASDSSHPPARNRIPNLGILFKYCTNKEVFLFSVACFCAFIHGASRPAVYLLFGAIIGTVGDPSANFMSDVEFISIAMVILAFIVLIVSTTWFYLFSRIAACLSHRVQQAYLASVLSKDVAWYDVKTPAEIPTRLTEDVEKIQVAVASKAGNFVMNLSQAVSGLTLGFAKGWIIALVCCGCIPVIVFTRMLLANSMKRSSRAAQSLYARAGAVAEEVLLSIRTVAAFGGEARESRRYEKLLGEGKSEGVKVGISVGFSTALVLSSMFAIYSLALWIAALLIEHEVVNNTTGEIYQGSDIYVVLSSVIMSAFAFGLISPSLQAFTEGTTALEGLYQTIAEHGTIEPSLLGRNRKGAPIAKSNEILQKLDAQDRLSIECLSFHDVSFKYPSRPEVTTLKNLSLTIRAGQKVALVGESGSGKSTIVALLERFYDPHSGYVSINGIDIKILNPLSLRSLFGYVGQEPVMFATTIRDNLVYGIAKSDIPSDDEIVTALKRANVYDFIKSLPLQLDTYCGPGGSQMSGGQKQRIAIARALLRKPQVLLLDEATSALDNESEKMVQKTIDALQNDSTVGRSLTTISVAHRLSTIKNSDVIFVLQRGGVLVEQGTHTELMALGGHYRTLVASQAGLSDTTMEDRNKMVEPVSPNLNIASDSFFLPQSEEEKKRKALLELGKSKEMKEKERIAAIAKAYKVPWRRLLTFTKGSERWYYVLGCAGAAGKGASFPLHALLLSNVVSWYYLTDTSEMMRKVGFASLMYIGLSVGVFVAVFASTWAFAHIGEEFTMKMRSDCFRHMLSQDMSFFDNPDNAPARLLMSLSSWASKMNVLAGQIVEVFVEFFAALISGLTIAFVASPKLAGILIGTLPLLVLAIVTTSRFVWGGGARDDVGSKQAALVASEAVQNMRTVRALTGEASTLVSYGFFSYQRVEEENRKSLKTSIVFGLSMMVAYLPYALGFYVGGLFVDEGSLSMQQMTQVLLGLILTSVGAGQALAYLPDIKAAKAAAHDIFLLLDQKSKINPFDTSKESAVACGDGVISFDNVVFAYPQRPETKILRGLTFQVQQGLKVALVGPSGSGKSSVIALLQRFYDPNSGSIRIGGCDIRYMNVASLRSVIGYVGQEPVLFDTSLEMNVLYGNERATRDDLERVRLQAKLDFLSDDNVKWETGLGPKGGLLSGGQKQRTAIARALVRDPKILMLDEATSALDSASEAVVQKAIDQATVGRTTFMIAHRLSTIKNADWILVIVAGELVEQGTHEQLMERGGMYSQLYKKGIQ